MFRGRNIAFCFISALAVLYLTFQFFKESLTGTETKDLFGIMLIWANIISSEIFNGVNSEIIGWGVKPWGKKHFLLG